jgi:hypothetical protein
MAKTERRSPRLPRSAPSMEASTRFNSFHCRSWREERGGSADLRGAIGGCAEGLQRERLLPEEEVAVQELAGSEVVAGGGVLAGRAFLEGAAGFARVWLEAAVRAGAEVAVRTG